jgi:hypothetical protein
MSSGVIQVAEEAGFLLATRRRRLALLLPKVLWRPSEIVLSREDYELDRTPGKKLQHKLSSDGKVEKQKQTESAWVAGEVRARHLPAGALSLFCASAASCCLSS